MRVTKRAFLLYLTYHIHNTGYEYVFFQARNIERQGTIKSDNARMVLYTHRSILHLYPIIHLRESRVKESHAAISRGCYMLHALVLQSVQAQYKIVGPTYFSSLCDCEFILQVVLTFLFRGVEYEKYVVLIPTNTKLKGMYRN